MTFEKLTLTAIRARAVDVPMTRPLTTGGGAVATAPLVLVDLETAEGVTGHSYVFGYTPRVLKPFVALIEELGRGLEGDLVAPLALEEKLQGQLRLLGVQGLAGMALSGIDMAAWDALAKAAGLPLVRLLGGEPRPLSAYNSNGLGLIGPEKAGPEAAELAAPGFRAVKVRLGYPELETDVAVVRAVRKALGDDVLLMSDFNQCLLVAEAERRIARLEGEGLAWIEEPTRWDDFQGYARIREKAHTPIQMGENCWGARDMVKVLDAGSCDLFMPDLGKCGGVSGWLRAAALAEPIGLALSSHLYPEVSAHMLAATPTRHWLEYVDWANPLLAEPLTLEEGRAVIPDRPGNGLAWDEAAVARYLV